MMQTGVSPIPSFPSRHLRYALALTGATLGLAVAHPVVVVAAASAQAPASPSAGIAERPWFPVAEEGLAGAPPPHVAPGKYRVLRLDRDRLKDILARAPLERPGEVNKSAVVLTLPWPDGTLKPFRIQEALNVEPGLKARCPAVKTYRGRGIDDRSAYVHFEWSSLGLHAKIHSGEAGALIGPYSSADPRNYIVYYARDWRRAPDEEAEGAPPGGQSVPPSASASRSSVAAIDEIAIKRVGFGREHPYKLTLRRDGAASLIVGGVMVEHACQGSIPPEDFARVAALMERMGFFELKENYYDPQVADGDGTITSAVVDGRLKEVQNVNRTAPSSVEAIEAAIDALGERVVWTESRP